MISLFIRLGIIATGLAALIAFLPNSTGLSTEATDAITYIVGLARSFDWLFPINTLFTVLGLAIAFHLGVFLFKSVRWILHLISQGTAGNS